MNAPVRVVGTDGAVIESAEEWLEHAGPGKGLAQWRDGYSAKEQAKAWLSAGEPALPREWSEAVAPYVPVADEVIAWPERVTRLDRFARARQHDLLVELRSHGQVMGVVGVEAKACEPFDGPVRDRAGAQPPSKQRPRCNLLARALFGRPVFDETDGTLLDAALADHGYQLWTAAVGSIIEAQARGLKEAILVVHQFRPADPSVGYGDGDTRDWTAALEANAAALMTFVAAIADGGGRSFATPFVAAGTQLTTLKVESTIRPGKPVIGDDA